MTGTKSENLVSALIKAHKDMPDLIKDASNPHFKSTFSSLPNVIETVTDSLHKHGLVVFQIGEVDEGGRAVLTTVLKHTSGESISSSLPLRAANPDNPQQLGSSITYMRRYGLLAILNLAADDDDGETATGRGGNSSTGSSTTKRGGVSEAQKKFINDLMVRVRKATSLPQMNKVAQELVKKDMPELTSADAKKIIDKLQAEEQASKEAF